MSRRRGQRETAFSFDSFLDLVTNVVGIIIRLILVVWVGARSYPSLKQVLDRAQPAAEKAVDATPIEDPLQFELERQKQELAKARERLLEQLRQMELAKDERSDAEKKLAALKPRRLHLASTREKLDEESAGKQKGPAGAGLSLAQIEKRRAQLLEEVAALEKQPPMKKTLRYQVPVSQPVDVKQFFFECKEGRVTFLDMDAMHREIESSKEDIREELRSRWKMTGTTQAVGDFRLQYVYERQAGVGEGRAAPSDTLNFSARLTGEVCVPVNTQRGETPEQALAPGSEFRRIADSTAAGHNVVTFMVYPDSFPVYRRLRDYLVQRDVTVAANPLHLRDVIAFSPNGIISRGQ